MNPPVAWGCAGQVGATMALAVVCAVDGNGLQRAANDRKYQQIRAFSRILGMGMGHNGTQARVETARGRDILALETLRRR
jgi:hypothetical protein